MEKPSAAVIIPTYNEADNITAIVNDLLEVFHGSGIEGWIVVVDDGSPDGTGRIVGEIAAGNPMVMLLERGRKMGIGSAYIDGFRYVLSKMDVRAAVTMDADGSHPPQMVPHLIKALEEDADVAVASRYIAGGSWDAQWRRKIVSRGANLLARVATGFGVRDMTSGFRAYRIEAIKALDLGRLESGYVFQVAMLYQLLRLGFRVVEIPFRFTPRRGGKSKLGIPEYLNYLTWSMKTLYGRLR